MTETPREPSQALIEAQLAAISCGVEHEPSPVYDPSELEPEPDAPIIDLPEETP